MDSDPKQITPDPRKFSDPTGFGFTTLVLILIKVFTFK